jgi:hypothetical protein
MEAPRSIRISYFCQQVRTLPTEDERRAEAERLIAEYKEGPQQKAMKSMQSGSEQLVTT